MITEFQLFELFSKSYDVGDYVLLKVISTNLVNIYPYVKILKILSPSTYEVEAFIDDINTNLIIHNDRIKRKLKQNEIDEFNIKKNTSKYNL